MNRYNSSALVRWRLGAAILLSAFLLDPVSKALADFNLDPPVTNQSIAFGIGFDGRPGNSFEYHVRGDELMVVPEQDYFRIHVSLISFNGDRLLRRSITRIEFLLGEAIDQNASIYINSGNGNSIGLGSYDATRFSGTVDWHFIDTMKGRADAFYRGKAELFIGFRAQLEDGAHHGWIHFSRPDTHFTTLFLPVAYDWNPIPDAPIRAGLPPEIPLHPEVTPEGLRLHWHPSLASWILEFREALGGDAPWQPVEGIPGVEAVLEFPAQAGYYRLRRP